MTVGMPSAGAETLSAIRAIPFNADGSGEQTKKKKKKQSSLLAPMPGDGFVHTMTQLQGERIIRAQVETVVARLEPLDRIIDPFNVAALLISHPLSQQTHIPYTISMLWTLIGIPPLS